MDEWIKKMPTHIVEYYSALAKTVQHGTVWINLDNFMLSKIS